jgi:predicted lipoprotein with Yx(FWY)xxD motif
MRKLVVVLGVLAALLVVGVLAASAQEGDMMSTVMLGGTEDLGPFLVNHDGMTLYMFTNDEPGVSNCAGDCATNWPPLTVAEDEIPTLAAGIPGRINAITRDDGTRQVVYNGMPLYTWKDDMAAGDATGQGVGDVWYVVTPPTVSLGSNADLGDFLVGSNGLTLYQFNNDEMGVSSCYDQCADNWPPLLVDSADAVSVTPGLVGELGTTERDDGTLQVTFDGHPLYFWKDDMGPGDATGQGVGDVWYVVKPPTLSVGNTEDMGDFLIGPDGMTLYLFTNDEGSTSACYDQCAINWPPLYAAAGEELTAGEGVPGELGTTERDDGTLQVTYDGSPLYYWIKDVNPGDTTGQNVGNVWFVVPPEGSGM